MTSEKKTCFAKINISKVCLYIYIFAMVWWTRRKGERGSGKREVGGGGGLIEAGGGRKPAKVIWFCQGLAAAFAKNNLCNQHERHSANTYIAQNEQIIMQRDFSRINMHR